MKHGDEFRSLESDDDVFGISFDAALALMRAPKQSRRRQATQKKTLRELTHDGTTLKLLSGRYGPYVTDGTHQRVDSEDDESRGADLRAGRGAARRAPRCGALAATAEPEGGAQPRPAKSKGRSSRKTAEA